MTENQLTVVAPSIVPAASPSTSQVCAALATAQGKFSNPKRTKTATVRPRDGATGYTFSYAPLEEVVNAIKDGLAENGLSRQQYLFRADDGTYWLRTVLWHASGEWISGDYPVIYAKDSAQGFAGGVTYAKRNGLSLLLGLAAEDDDDGNVGDGNVATIKPTQTRKPKPPAANVMVDHDPETGEVIEPHAEARARQVNEELEAAQAKMQAAAMGKGGLPAEQQLRKAFNDMPLAMQDKLRPFTRDWLRLAREIDQAHAMAREQP